VKVTVLVRPKQGILDPQGEAIDRSLRGLGYPTRSVRAGKLFDLDIDVADAATATATARQLAERVLTNPLIESYEVVIDG
jgi:phosphoribosylformylglycinamidine synthase subunit PurS